MKQTALNLLGCSSFSALVLLSQTAQAELVMPGNDPSGSPLYAGYINPQAADSVGSPSVRSSSVQSPIDASGCSCQEAILNSDDIGNLAIDQLGCDCAGCRYTVLQMAQAGTEVNQPTDTLQVKP